MLIFGCCVGPSGRFDRIAAPALRDVMLPEDELVRETGSDGICAAYNRILERARRTPGCEGVVLIHDDVELGPSAREALVGALRTPGVGVVGAVGGRDLYGGQWFKASVRAGYANDSTGLHRYGTPEADVDAVDGLLLALAPAAFTALAFDVAGLPAFHGYDTDICLRARDRGLRVLVTPLPYVHHDKGGVGDEGAFHSAQEHLRNVWHPRWIRDPTPREQRREERRQGIAPGQLRRKRLVRKLRGLRRRLRAGVSGLR